jgi:poly(A) polymerase
MPISCGEHVLLTSLPAREIVLGRLAALVKSFVKTVSLACGHSETTAEMAGGKIFTFGSYRLGVHGPGTDIDTLCVVPKHVSREDFFDVFEGMLRNTEGVTEVSVSYPSLPCKCCR